MFILKKGHQPGVYVPLRALFLVGDTVMVNEVSTVTIVTSYHSDYSCHSDYSNHSDYSYHCDYSYQ